MISVRRKPPLSYAVLSEDGQRGSVLAVHETSPVQPRQPRLLDRVRSALRTRHYSRRTEEAYVAWIRRFIFFHGKRHPAEMGGAEITAFLTSLATEGRVAASTQNQALSALLFLYRDVLRKELAWLEGVVRARQARRLPVVLNRQEVKAVIGHLHDGHWLMATLLYGAGLRLLECLHLRVKDVDFGSNQILVRGGKGNNDRRTILPAAAREPLLRHLEGVRRQHEQDLARGAGWVALPGALGLKYPAAGRSWAWQWVFPA